VSRSYDGWWVTDGALPAASLPTTSVGLTFAPWRAGIGVGTYNGPNRTGDAASCDAEDGSFVSATAQATSSGHRPPFTTSDSERVGDLITIVGYDPTWPDRYAAQQVALRAALGRTAIRIEHIGSTSVPGLAAKPIIDVQVSVTDLTDEDA
jgi:GrpB protein